MIKANLKQIRGGAVLAIIRDAKRRVESVTVFTPFNQCNKNGTEYKSVFGSVDIIYSFASTYKMLDRKDSGFYTGKALKGETFIITDEAAALKEANRIWKREHNKPVKGDFFHD